MKDNGVLSLTDSTPIVMLNVEQVRQVIRQEIQTVMTRDVSASNEHRSTSDSALATQQYLSAKEAATVSRLGVSTIRQYVRNGSLRSQRKGRRVIITRKELDRFLLEEHV